VTKGPSLLRRLLLGQLAVLALFASFAAGNYIWQFYREQGSLNYLLQRYANTLGSVVDRFQAEQVETKVLHDFISTYGELVQEEISLEKTGMSASKSGLAVIIAISHAGTSKEITRSRSTPAEILLPAPSLGVKHVTMANQSWHIATVLSPSGKHYIQFAEPKSSAFSGVKRVLLNYIVYPFAIFLPLSALLMGFVLHFGLKPLNILTNTIERRDPNDLTPLTLDQLDTETKPLIQAINTLMIKLRRTLELERSFLADAAHELRTPLAVIQAQSHLLEIAANESEREQSARKLENGITRAASLIEKLLAGAQMNSENFKPQFEQLSVNDLVQERVAILSILAVKKQIELSFHQSQRLVTAISKPLFVSAFDNILDNAIRYTPEFGTITVSVARHGDREIEIAILDTGIGISPDEHTRVFERFHRVIRPEQNGLEPPGSGLGLSIVKQAIQTHGGTVHLRSGSDNTGLLVQLLIPLKH
jgi:signal transduction histidine kinase